MAVIDLSRLPPPQIVDVPDFETLLAERKAAFVALYPVDEQDAVRRTLALESEPVTKLLQESTYREILLRQRINEAAQAVMVAYSMGNVLTVLSREGDGTAVKDLLDVVEKALNSESVRPVADRLTVRSAEIIPYRVEATIFLYPGPEAEPVMAAAKASLQKYIASQTRLGRDIRRSAIYAALHVEGVQRVELTSPLEDVVLDKTQAASCTEWSVTNGGTDE
ncbi:baseplate J/gp47 family protein [Salmonella enterica]|uniref:baseplate J/gp47 family protein n=1 Tax=Salmonella enterica TaxID=28901 RepID=UPI0004F681EA|nr:baseplate J/gp47 family protein [Salmonella enterica]AIM71706.1 baseplate assembly protein [Salmonella enterica subsp. enterica serovar Enteritidis]